MKNGYYENLSSKSDSYLYVCLNFFILNSRLNLSVCVENLNPLLFVRKLSSNVGIKDIWCTKVTLIGLKNS